MMISLSQISRIVMCAMVVFDEFVHTPNGTLP